MHRKLINDKSRNDRRLRAPAADEPSERPGPASPADDLFAALDHRQIGEGAVSWLTEVAAIHMERQEAWVQVAPVGQSSRRVILHLSRQVTAKHALATLAKLWSTMADETVPQVIHVHQPI
jgi:hypothetical protein